MALINCEECGKEISDKASTCPHCGAPLSSTVDSKPINAKPISEVTPKTDSATEDSSELLGSMIGWTLYAKPLSDNWSVAFGWIFGIIFFLIGITSFDGNSLLAPILILAISFILLPPIRTKFYEKTNKTIASGFRIMIVLSALFFSSILTQTADKEKLEETKQKFELEQATREAAQKEKELKEFKDSKAKILQSIADQIKTKSFKDALPACNTYMKFGDKDLTPLCTTVKTEITKIEQKEQEERARKEVAEAAKAKAKEEAELKKSMGPRAWKLHKKHPEWSVDECKNVAENRYWIGMSTEMMVASLGRPDSAKPSNYGSGRQWQYCYTDGWFQCFYDNNDDGIIDSYN